MSLEGDDDDDTKLPHWLDLEKQGEYVMDGIFSLTSPQVYRCAKEVMNRIKDHEFSLNKYDDYAEAIREWPSSFSGIAVIANRLTPPHYDTNGSIRWFDYLLSLGTHGSNPKESTKLRINTLGANISYNPGSVIAVSGKLLSHSQTGWVDGDRVVYAHFLREKVLAKAKLMNPSWVEYRNFAMHMEEGFLGRIQAATGFTIM